MMQIACKGCGEEFSAGELRDVGTWKFCEPCLRKLLEPKPEPEPEPEPERTPEPRATPAAEPREVGSPALRVSVSVQAPAKRACSLCDSELEGNRYADMGGVLVCRPCAREFFPDLVAPEPEPEPDPHRKPGPFVPTPIPTTKSDTCTGCGRRIPLGGGRVVGDDNLCPECYSKVKPAEVREPEPVEGSSAQAESAAPPVGQVCDACGRGGQGAAIASIEGFSLCKACTGSDVGAALEIARARHRARLRRLREEIDGS